MVGSTMKDARIQDLARSRFVPVLIDKSAHDHLVARHGLYMYPTIIWLAPDGEVLERSLFGQEADDVVADMEDVLAALDERERGD